MVYFYIISINYLRYVLMTGMQNVIYTDVYVFMYINDHSAF